MDFKHIKAGEKVSYYIARSKNEPKYLKEFLDELDIELKETECNSLEDFKQKINLEDRHIELTSNERISGTYVDGTTALKDLSYNHKKFKTAIISVSESFRHGEL